MPCGERRELIAGEVRAKGRVRVGDLVRNLGVSRMTIHRDLQHLDAQGRVRRIRSGATTMTPADPTDPATPAADTA
ncbi:DeoR family transcriptional regulator [Streptomyces sp. NBC_01264]|uniref:DeoR family transcriptional regulator n=1 Tax=Streptomyces sp. NBC_01264 TaxID=2903804 RepID=UPI00338DBD5F